MPINPNQEVAVGMFNSTVKVGIGSATGVSLTWKAW